MAHDGPLYRRPESEAALETLDLLRDLVAGTPAMHQHATRYIRRWAAEDSSVYGMRSKCEQLDELYARALSASVGLMFATPPQLTGEDAVLDVVREHWWSLDGAGVSGDVLLKRTAYATLRDGVCAVLVDYPPEGARDAQPIWSRYERRDILSWHETTIDGRPALAMVTLLESATEADGAYGVVAVPYVRELRLVDGVATWTLWDCRDKDPRQVDAGVFRGADGVPFDRLPLVTFYAGEPSAAFVCRPPLLGAAFANLGHYQISTDLRFAEQVAAYAQPVVVGDFSNDAIKGQQGSLQLGPLVGVHLKAGGSYSWSEPAGTSFAALATAIKEKRESVARMSLSFLGDTNRKSETAEGRRLDMVAEFATLATATQSIQDAANMCLEWHARYLGLPRELAPSVTFATEYSVQQIDTAVMTALGVLVREGLPRLTAVEVLQSIGVVRPDVDAVALAMEWDAGAGAGQVDANFEEEPAIVGSIGDAAPVARAAAVAGDVQATALNGAQVLALKDLLTQVAQNQMPAATVKVIIAAAFPFITSQQVDSMIAGLRGFTPAPEGGTQ